ncbi:MAG: TIGR01212 family radical SAM protein [Desulfomonile tiedjei]|nr:TIGR01212 family radical SAM protein [Desulfomonile tiedjei]
MVQRYRSLSGWLKERFHEPVRKITIDAGLGCPNRDGSLNSGGCIYCNPRGSGTGASVQGLSVAEQMDRGIEFLSRRYGVRKFIAYFQSFTNTYGEPDQLFRLYSDACHQPEVVGMAIGTRPDCVSDGVLDILEEMSRERLIWIEYGLQSAHKKTLDLINRGHGPEAFFDAVARTGQRGIPIVAHLILGLPGESIEDMVQTAGAVADAGVQGVKLHPLYIIRGTALEAMYREGNYLPMTEESAAEATLAVMEALPQEMVIHRMTSDPHEEELVAPLWMLDRRGVRTRLNELMQRKDFRQGSHYPRPCEVAMKICDREKLKSEATPT